MAFKTGSKNLLSFYDSNSTHELLWQSVIKYTKSWTVTPDQGLQLTSAMQG